MYGLEGHKIRHNHRSSVPSNMIFYDSETKYIIKDGEQRLSLDFGWVGHYRYNKEKGFIDKYEKLVDNQIMFCDTIEKYAYRKSTLYMFAHNIFFDLQVSGFFKYMSKRGWILDFYYDKGLTYILTMRKEDRCIKCLSTTNYFDCSLKALSEMIGREKTEIDFEKSSRSEKIDYCYNDMIIIKESMKKYFQFILEKDLGMFSMTKSSQSFNAYRHRFMSQGIFIHQEDEVIELEKLAYHGGRCECYHIGQLNNSQYVCLDINSLYPYIMQTQKLPYMLIDYGKDLNLNQAEDLLVNYAVIAEVEISTDQPIYAVRYNGKLVFPIGEFTAYLCTEGLKTAIKNGHTKSIKRYAVYEQTYLFTDYVEYFYKLRQQYKESGNRIYEQLCKYFMNTLYGKFGQQRTITESETDIQYDGYNRELFYDIETEQYQIMTEMLNKRWIEYGEENAKNTIVAIPAHITEYGRLALWKLLNTGEDVKAVYCDTDSIIIPKKNLGRMARLLDEKELGKLKLEYTTDSITIHGCKDYEVDNSIKIKGVPKSAFQILNDTFIYDQFLGQATHLTKNVDDTFIIRPLVKVNKREYDKGIVLPSGKVEPISLINV